MNNKVAVVRGCHMREHEVRAFKSRWPGHGLDDVHRAWFQFQGTDLVDYNLYDAEGELLTHGVYDGPALLALSQYAWDIVSGTK